MSKTPAPVLTMRASDLHKLVRPVIPFTADDRTMYPMLCGVRLSTFRGHVIAEATDRFAAVMHRQKLEQHEPEVPGKNDDDRGTPGNGVPEGANTHVSGFAVVMPVPALRRALSVFRAGRHEDSWIQLTPAPGHAVTIETLEHSIGYQQTDMPARLTLPSVLFNLEDDVKPLAKIWPTLRQILGKAWTPDALRSDTPPVIPIEDRRINADFFARLGAVKKHRHDYLDFVDTADGKMIRFANEDRSVTGLVMRAHRLASSPTDAYGDETPPLDWWRDLYAAEYDTAEVPA